MNINSVCLPLKDVSSFVLLLGGTSNYWKRDGPIKKKNPIPSIYTNCCHWNWAPQKTKTMNGHVNIAFKKPTFSVCWAIGKTGKIYFRVLVHFPRTETAERGESLEWVNCTRQFHSTSFCDMHRGGTRLMYLLDTVPQKVLKSACSLPIWTETTLFTMDTFSLGHDSVMITEPLV